MVSKSVKSRRQQQSNGNDRTKIKRIFLLCLQAIFNAIVIGLAAKGLVYLIDIITNLSFFGRLSLLPATPEGNHLGWLVLIVPLAGSIVVGLMARFGSRAIGGHGIPEAMEKIITGDSKIPPAMTFLKPLSAAISIGTGGPFGAEGPIIATGGALGSLTGQWMHISSAERKIILAAGACAGMTAIFGSPLAAVFLAIELLLFEFSARSIIPVVAACVTGAVMHNLLFGSVPVFHMNPIPEFSGVSIIICLFTGLMSGLVATGISKSIYLIEDLFERLPVHWMWWPAIGSLAIGITGYFSPATMGVGYENIRLLLSGNVSFTVLFSLGVLKFISWSVSLGSGTSGGTLAPLLTIGGAFGLFIGMLLRHYFPGLPVDLPTIALAGMAAMFSGASRAVLTSIVFALETTGRISGLAPLMAACTGAYFVSLVTMKGTIMTEKIRRRGIHTPDIYEPDLLSTVRVKKLMIAPQPMPEITASVFENDSAAWAAEQMGKHNVEILAVRKSHQDSEISGSIGAGELLRFYSAARRNQSTLESPRRTKKLMLLGRRMLDSRRKQRNFRLP